jgi:hypothetical protein
VARRLPEWEAATHFAITTVNVPDRLDLQEERDRADAEDLVDEQRRRTLRLWMKRLVVAAAVGVLITVVYTTLQPLQREVSAPKVAERLTEGLATGRCCGHRVRFSPSPRMVIRGITTGDVRIDEASLLINWKDLWNALRGGQWVWGETTIAPMTVTFGQAGTLASALPAGANALPMKISTIRFESIRVSDTELLPGRYEALIRRGADGVSIRWSSVSST